jgi:hypothetical protein
VLVIFVPFLFFFNVLFFFSPKMGRKKLLNNKNKKIKFSFFWKNSSGFLFFLTILRSLLDTKNGYNKFSTITPVISSL